MGKTYRKTEGSKYGTTQQKKEVQKVKEQRKMKYEGIKSSD
jgi:hypothetical protein